MTSSSINIPLTIIKAFSIWIIFQIAFYWGGAVGPLLPQSMKAIVFGGSLSLFVYFLTKVYLRTDTLTMGDLGMTLSPGSWMRFSLSLVVGMAFFGAFFVAYLLFTPVKIVPILEPNYLNTIFVSLLSFVMLGVMEELVFRGYFMKKLETAIGIRGAIYLTSIAFGLYHGITIDSITGPAIWGLLYAVLAYWSKGLAIPIGFHIGANYIQALFSQKEKWVSGLWNFDVTQQSTLFTIEQVTLMNQLALLTLAIFLVEYYLRKVRPKQEQ
ncbi:type II CAAX endopeptidase family protein [Temperatibacter marinus]|uniref:Type II CAAX endopeptidase family protein n=1 Tax=Temperatibacter marinus TaxID=1456591 RepID=A0AA52EK85_9PROT|nr:type II CAAX endopeptidase family protein [Temperatibacter marinus]WND04062.1 type II CAAX endopeptidase family protein [Temperatibacter marinus]